MMDWTAVNFWASIALTVYLLWEVRRLRRQRARLVEERDILAELLWEEEDINDLLMNGIREHLGPGRLAAWMDGWSIIYSTDELKSFREERIRARAKDPDDDEDDD